MRLFARVSAFAERLRASVGSAVAAPTGHRFIAIEEYLRSSARSTLIAEPASVDQLVHDVNSALVELHGRRLIDLGADGSGLFSHYASLVEQGAILSIDEIEAFGLIRETLPAYGEYTVLRAGLGELAFLINMAGLRVTACEPNGARLEALNAGLERLGALAKVNPDSLRVISGFVPDRVDIHPALAIATAFIVDGALEVDDDFRRGLRRFDGLLINPRLFIRVRESHTDQLAVAAFLFSLGFTEVREFPAKELVYFARPVSEWGVAQDHAADAVDVMPHVSVAGPGFDALVQRLLAAVPEVTVPNTGTTWVERRIRKFDLKSTFGNDE